MTEGIDGVADLPRSALRGRFDRLALVLRAVAALPDEPDSPTLLVAQAATAVGAQGAVLGQITDGQVEILATFGYEPEQLDSCGPLQIGDRGLPLTWAATVGEAVWLSSQEETLQRFPQIVALTPRDERAYAALPLIAGGKVLGVLGVSYDEQHRFTRSERTFLQGLADICALCMDRWAAERDQDGPPTPSAPEFAGLVEELSGAVAVDEVAGVIAKHAAKAVVAVFSNIAVVTPGGQTALLDHGAGLPQDVQDRWGEIDLSASTPLGEAITTGVPVWLPSLIDVHERFPDLVTDTEAAGLAATASLPLFAPGGGEVIGGIGFAWATPQQFDDQQRATIATVARLASDALGRSGLIAAERAGVARAERLARAASALVAAATLVEVANAVFEIGVRAFDVAGAGLALVDPDDPQSLVILDATGYDPEIVAAWNRFPIAMPSPAADAIRDGTLVYLSSDRALQARYPSAVEVLTSTGHRSWAAVPLAVGNRTLGALTLSFDRPHALDEHDQLDLFGLASHVASAVDRAQTHDRDHGLVVAIQRSLMSGAETRSSSVELAGHYLPAAAENVGGDWYDSIPLPDDRTMLVIGDVVGHGIDAAITMSQLRSAARVLAPSHGPAALLEALDRYALTLAGARYTTAAIIVIDPATMTATYSSAGHPPALAHLTDGSIVRLDQARGTLLGFHLAPRPEASISLGDGATIVAYTDGLIERRNEPIDVGIDRLTRAIASSTEPVRDLCDGLARSLIDAGSQRDDAAILCARVQHVSPPASPERSARRVVSPDDSATSSTHEPAASAADGPSDRAPAAAQFEIRNVRAGQVIEIDVTGPWSEAGVEERLLRLVALRQPAELRLAIEAAPTEREPQLPRTRAALEDVGGTLTVTMVPPSPAISDN